MVVTSLVELVARTSSALLTSASMFAFGFDLAPFRFVGGSSVRDFGLPSCSEASLDYNCKYMSSH